MESIQVLKIEFADNEKELVGLADAIRGRLRKNYDAVIAICGYEGDGKSTLAIKLAAAIDKDFSLEKNVIYNPRVETVVESVLHGLPKYSAVVVDEAIKVLYKRGWMNRLQIFLNQVFAICRSENKAVILCMPEFTDFDAFFRQHRILIWIQILERGTAVAFVKSWLPFVSDKWNLKRNQTLLEKAMGKKKVLDLDSEDKLVLLRRSSNYFVDFEFNDLSKHFQKEYQRLKSEVKTELIPETDNSRVALYKNAFGNLVEHFYLQGTTQVELSKISGLSVASINNSLRDKNVRRKDKQNQGKEATQTTQN